MNAEHPTIELASAPADWPAPFTAAAILDARRARRICRALR